MTSCELSVGYALQSRTAEAQASWQRGLDILKDIGIPLAADPIGKTLSRACDAGGIPRFHEDRPGTAQGNN